MTTAAGTRPTTESVRGSVRTAPTPAPEAPDRRRITERDPDVARLRARTVARLTRSLRTYVADLRRAHTTPHGQARAGDAASAFIQRQVGILRDAYADAHREGVRDYWAGVSRRRAPHVDVDPRTERARMAFYAPSVAKMAHEALMAAQATTAARLPAALGEDDPWRMYFVGGHPPGYTQNRIHGKFGPGNGRQEESGGGGGGGAGGGTSGGGGLLGRLRAAVAAKREGEQEAGALHGAAVRRRDALDAKYGHYSEGARAAHVGRLLGEHPELRAALAEHYAGHGAPLSAESVSAHAARLGRDGAGARAALDELHGLSEWSLLHNGHVDGEGMLTLYHGSHGHGAADVARDLARGRQRAGLSFARDEATATRFATSYQRPGESAHVLRARVPASAVVAHPDLFRGTSFRSTAVDAENEYILGTGTGLRDVTRTFSELDGGMTLADGDPLSKYFVGVQARVNLQADITWAGAQDGYVDGGAADGANPYAAIAWVLDPAVKTGHCSTCPIIAAGSPYDPPWVAGGHHLNATPGDGSTECGAACKCALEYVPGRAAGPGASPWDAPGVTAPPAPPDVSGPDETPGEWPRVAAPTGEDDEEIPAFTAAQVDALDAYRAAAEAWAGVRDDLPALPSLFGAPDPEALDKLRRGVVLPGAAPGGLPPAVGNDWVAWDDLTAGQQRVLEGLYQALLDVGAAFPETAAADLADLEPDDLFLPNDGGSLAEWWDDDADAWDDGDDDDGAIQLAGHDPGYHGQGHDPKTGHWEPGEGHEGGGSASGGGSGSGGGGGASGGGGKAEYTARHPKYKTPEEWRERLRERRRAQYARTAKADLQRLAARAEARKEIERHEAGRAQAEAKLATLEMRVHNHLEARRAAGHAGGEPTFMRKAGEVRAALHAYIAARAADIARITESMPPSHGKQRVADMTPDELRARGLLAELAWLGRWIEERGEYERGEYERGEYERGEYERGEYALYAPGQARDYHGRFDFEGGRQGGGQRETGRALQPHEATVHARGGGGGGAGGGGAGGGGAGHATVEYKGEARDAMRARFGRDLTDQEVGALALARAGDHVTARRSTLSVTHADGSTTEIHFLHRDGGGTDLYNWFHTSAAMRASHLLPGLRESGAPTDYGRLRDQMRAAQHLGIHGIVVKIGRGGDDWRLLPRMGYDARLDAEPLEWKQALPPHLAHIERLSEAMATAEGRAWSDASLTTPHLYFDLTPGSASVRMFGEYGVATGQATP